MPDRASSPEEKARVIPETSTGDRAKEAIVLEAADGPCVPAPIEQFQITNLQQWIDLCA
jgi:hypothetical protein